MPRNRPRLRNDRPEVRSLMVLAVIAAALLLRGPMLRAQGAGAGGVSPDAAPIPVEVSVAQGADGITLGVRGAYELPDDATVTVFFSNAIEFIPLQQRDVPFKAGRYTVQFGPFPELCPGNYLIRVDFTPWSQSSPVQDLLRQKNRSFKAKGEAVLPYKTDQDVRGQMKAYVDHANARIREMRTLLIELERKVAEFRDRYARTHDADEAQRWHQGWRERTSALHESLHDILRATGFGAPYKQSNEVLLWMANRLVYYGNRYAVRIVGEETLAPEDVGKPMEDLAKIDHLPSGMIRTQFFEAYRGLRNFVPYDDPNAVEVARARPKMLSAFAALVRAHDGLREKATQPNAKPPTKAEWESALSPYRRLRGEAEEICQGALIFCDRQANRRGESEKAGADRATALLQLRDQIDALEAVLKRDLLEKPDPDAVAGRIETVVIATFRPSLTEILSDLRDVMQDAVGNMTTAVQREVRNRTPYLEVLGVQLKDKLPPIRTRLGELEEMLKPLDPENRVVRHYAGQIERGKAICDQMREMMNDALNHIENYVEAAHPSIMPLYEALGEFEKGLSPPPPKKKES